MPIGLKNAGTIFKRLMDKVLENLIGKICFVQLDEEYFAIIVFSDDVEGHQERLKMVIERLKQIGLQHKLKKSEFLQPTICFLGHVI